MKKFEYQVLYAKGKMESELKSLLDNYGKLGYKALFITSSDDIIMERELYNSELIDYINELHQVGQLSDYSRSKLLKLL